MKIIAFLLLLTGLLTSQTAIKPGSVLMQKTDLYSEAVSKIPFYINLIYAKQGKHFKDASEIAENIYNTPARRCFRAGY